MNGVGGKTHGALLAILALYVMQSIGHSALAVRGALHSWTVPILPAEQFLENLQELY